MNYSKILRADIANGTGFRVSLWVSGCERHCKGCFNPEAWDCNFGQMFDEKAKKKIYAELENEWCDGLSILGGEPLSRLSDNRKQVIEFCKDVKKRFPTKNIWLWSGYTVDEIRNNDNMKEILDCVDVLVDGEFDESKKDLSIPFRGSSNQNIIRLKCSGIK